MFHYFLNQKYVYILKKDQVLEDYGFNLNGDDEYFYDLPENIKEWLKNNKIKYYFYTGFSKSVFVSFSECAPYLIFKNKSDAVLFKLVWD